MKTLRRAWTSVTPAQQSPTKPFFDDKTKTDAAFFGGQPTTGGAPFFNTTQLSKGSKPLESLIQRGKTEDDIKTKLTERYKLAGVLEDGKAWTEEELTRLGDTLMGLPEDDKAVLKDLNIVRVVAIGGSDSRTLGQFGTSQNVATIKLANIAFDNKTKQDTMETIAHEVGHAVASFKRRTAIETFNKALIRQKQEAAIFDAADDTADKARNICKSKYALRKQLSAQYNALGDEVTADSEQLYGEIEALNVEIKALETQANQLLDERDVHLSTAKKTQLEVDAHGKELAATQIDQGNIDRVSGATENKKAAFEKSINLIPKAINEKDRLEAANYSAIVKETGDSIVAFHKDMLNEKLTEEDVDALIAPVNQQIERRKKEATQLKATAPNNELIGFYDTIVVAQDAYFKAAKAQASVHKRKTSVQKFVDFVEDKDISPNITAYAAQSWPHKPEEFYAEAYSFFVTDKKRLEAYSLALYGWFEKGEYKS